MLSPSHNSIKVGLIGLGTMGRNLALNLSEHGISVVGYDRKDIPSFSKDIRLCASLPSLVKSIEAPRIILLMIPSGPGIDEQIEELVPLLNSSDLLIDGGNSYYRDTERRADLVQSAGCEWIDMGISGGEYGARHGPSMAAGGSPSSCDRAEKVFGKIAGTTGETRCFARIGPCGAGHFVKMIHNGIEYAAMQMIAESFLIMRKILDMPIAKIHEVYSSWVSGEIGSYLINITADILTKRDPETGNPLVEMISEKIRDKGTGRWAAAAALELGVPAPTLAEAVHARFLSGLDRNRLDSEEEAARKSGKFSDSAFDIVESLKQALYCSFLCAYAQGFSVLTKATKEYRWDLDLAKIAQIWQNGSIIRSPILDPIGEAFITDHGLDNILSASSFRGILSTHEFGLHQVVELGVRSGVPLPTISSALAYYDAFFLKSAAGGNLIQAQRDYFGAHGYERIDRPGKFHTKWVDP